MLYRRRERSSKEASHKSHIDEDLRNHSETNVQEPQSESLFKCG